MYHAPRNAPLRRRPTAYVASSPAPVQAVASAHRLTSRGQRAAICTIPMQSPCLVRPGQLHASKRMPHLRALRADNLIADGVFWRSMAPSAAVEFVVKPYGIHKFSTTIADFDLRRIRAANSDAQVVMDLSGVTFVRPSMLVLLRSFVELLLKGDPTRGISPRPRVSARPPKSKSVKDYLNTMNLFGHGAASEGSEAHHLPLCGFQTSDETETIANKLKQIAIGSAKNDLPQAELQRVGMALGTALGELLENFRKHSEATRRGFACAQYYSPGEYRDEGLRRRRRRGFFEIAVADTGIGVEKSLAVVPAHAALIGSGVNPCELATRFGVTSKPGVHGGYGLWVAKRLCERSEGAFKLASGRFSYASGGKRRGRAARLAASAEWPGTFVGLRLALSGQLDVTRVYDELPPLPLMEED